MMGRGGKSINLLRCVRVCAGVCAGVCVGRVFMLYHLI